jgi:hypothetical protein
MHGALFVMGMIFTHVAHCDSVRHEISHQGRIHELSVF